MAWLFFPDAARALPPAQEEPLRLTLDMLMNVLAKAPVAISPEVAAAAFGFVHAFSLRLRTAGQMGSLTEMGMEECKQLG